ncbi:hypothetical protein [Lapillicoccus jejuensis]|uniref:Uncharacterized protein n=1 Tax=Lapillicoccus jejuensis TaxID=402171 RepID=A0A542E1H6_9MICO|nr:hypothetical protein [Lapillicoccus jejuensis]TQJ09193.1 hypothetical protein FB458_2301 [Lapillicoccus jejuensis]
MTSRPAHRRRRPAAAAALLALALSTVLGACTGSSAPSPTPTSSTPAPTAAPTGVVTQAPGRTLALGAKFDWSRVDLARSYVAQLGADVPTFYELTWCDVEPQQGKRDWSAVDTVVQQARSLKVSMMLKLRVGACWATGDQQATKARGRKTESLMPADMTTYRSWVIEAVKRYSAQGVHVYAVENEVNSPSFWGGSIGDLEQLVTAAATAIRAADPQAKVADMGISSTAYGAGIAQRLLDQGQDAQAVKAYNTYYERRFGTRGKQIVEVTSADDLKTALSSDQASRNLEYLQLTTKLLADKVTDLRQVHFYESYQAAPLLMDYLRATTPSGVPVQVWEAGQFLRGGSLTDQERVDQMVKTVAVLLGRGASMVLWLPLVPNPDGRNADEPRYGLLEPDGSVRGTGKAFVAMARASAGATIEGIATKRADGVAFTAGGRTHAFVWATSGSVTLPADAGSVSTPTATATSGGGGGAGGSLGTTSPQQVTTTQSAGDLVKALS